MAAARLSLTLSHSKTRNMKSIAFLAFTVILTVGCNTNIQPDATMQKWTKLISTQFETLADGAPEIRCLLGNPASERDIDNAERRLNVKFPAEFRSLYSTHNGFGSAYDEDSNEIQDWLGLPLNQIRRLVDVDADWESPAHKKAAEQFLVVIDFKTGDFAGYKLNSEGQIIGDQLLIFTHERLDFTPEQAPNEFIFEHWPSLEAFLEDLLWDW